MGQGQNQFIDFYEESILRNVISFLENSNRVQTMLKKNQENEKLLKLISCIAVHHSVTPKEIQKFMC